MATKKNLNTFTVGAKVSIDCDIEIKADSLEDALSQARTFRVTDFVDIKGGHIDSEIEINTVFKNN